MRTLILTISIFVVSLALHGQGAGSTLVEITVGAHIPGGDFASTDIESESAGFALTGVDLNITSIYKITRRFGVGGALTGHSNWVNNAAYTSAFEQAYPDLENWDVAANRWAAGGLVAGPAVTLPLSNSLDFMIHSFAGGVMAYTPKVEIIGEVDQQKQYIRLYEQNKAWAFAIKVGASLMFSMGSRQYFTVGGGYQYSKPVFKDFRVLEYEDPEEPPEISTRSFALAMSAFTVTIGYGYYLR